MSYCRKLTGVKVGLYESLLAGSDSLYWRIGIYSDTHYSVHHPRLPLDGVTVESLGVFLSLPLPPLDGALHALPQPHFPVWYK